MKKVLLGMVSVLGMASACFAEESWTCKAVGNLHRDKTLATIYSNGESSSDIATAKQNAKDACESIASVTCKVLQCNAGSTTTANTASTSNMKHIH